MSSGRRFEDNISVEDLMKKPQKDLLVEIYIQAVKTNGTVVKNCSDIADLQAKIDDKVGTKELNRFERIFLIITGMGGFFILIFNIWDRLVS